MLKDFEGHWCFEIVTCFYGMLTIFLHHLWIIGSRKLGMAKGKEKVVVEAEAIDVELEDINDDFVEAEWSNSGISIMFGW